MTYKTDDLKIRHSFVLKFSLYITTCLAAILLTVLIYNYYISRSITLTTVKKNVENIAKSAVGEINGALSTCQQIPQDISSILEDSDFTEKELLALLKNIVKDNHDIYGCTIAFEPYMFDKKKYYFDPYYYKPNGVLKFFDLDNDVEYDYFKWDWYAKPKKMNCGAWTDPYFDEGGGNILMVTYSQPFYRTINGKKVFCGVVACDIDLNWLGQLIRSMDILEKGYSFILSSNGSYVAHKEEKYVKLAKSIFEVAKEKNDAKLQALGTRMINKQTGFEEYYSHSLNKKCLILYTPLMLTGWSVGIVLPEDELFYALNLTTLKLFIIGAAGYILALILIIFLASQMTIPLRTLAKATYNIGEGNFNVQLPTIPSTDEIGVLSRSFHIMQENLIKYITNLKETTAAKEKIDNELNIARGIQQSLLPHNFPSLKQIDLSVVLIPAKEVGGDLYDFFFIDNKRFCFAIGDVSGKGIPAALFMAVTKTLLRAKASPTMDPVAVLEAINEDLCKENDSSMFVTFFLGIFNIETGILEYCNAGHNPPLIHTARKGFYYFHAKNANLPLGVMTDVNYIGGKLQFFPEDIFFLYTDGVTEAMNISGMVFSEEKLLNILDHNKDEPISNIVDNVKKAIEQHAAGILQSDDITMLIFKFNG